MSKCKHTYSKGICTKCGDQDRNSIYNVDTYQRVEKAEKRVKKATDAMIGVLEKMFKDEVK